MIIQATKIQVLETTRNSTTKAKFIDDDLYCRDLEDRWSDKLGCDIPKWTKWRFSGNLAGWFYNTKTKELEV